MISLPQRLLALVFFLICCSCHSPKDDKAQQASQTPAEGSASEITLSETEMANIATGKIELRNISGGIKANGVLDVPPQNLVSVSAPMGGFVKNTELLQGMKVKKGQVLVVLEGQEYIQLQEDYLSSKSQLDYLQQEYQRQQDLANDNVNAAKVLQQSRSNFLSTKAKVDGLRAKLKLINISPEALEKGSIQSEIYLYAPISGFVSQVNVNLGMHVNPADMMFRLVDTDHLHAEAQVFEKDLSLLKVGQKVRLLLSNDSHERIATVYLIGKEITGDRTVRVHCHLEIEDPALIPGMYFSAVIETVNHEVPTLPDQAVVSFEGKKYIFVSSASHSLHFTMKEIQTGVSESGYTEIIDTTKGTATDVIVVKGAYELLSRMKNNQK